MDQFICGGNQFKTAFYYGIKQLAINREAIDSINVFPVPNGNTGTNLHKTLLSSLQEMGDGDHFGNMVQQCARGALSGASGSMGVIIANFLIGFADIVKNKDIASIDDLINGIKNGCSKAEFEMADICEGSVFDIAGAICDGMPAAESRLSSYTVTDVVSAIHQISSGALELIPSKNPALTAAGVNDAGAMCLFCFIDGVYQYSTGSPLGRCAKEIPVLPPLYKEEAKNILYSVEFLINDVTLPVEDIKKSLSDVGNPVMFAYEKGDTIKVLVRTTDPKRVFDRSARFGRSTRIKVDDLMDEQRYFFSAIRNKGVSQISGMELQNSMPPGEFGEAQAPPHQGVMAK